MAKTLNCIFVLMLISEFGLLSTQPNDHQETSLQGRPEASKDCGSPTKQMIYRERSAWHSKKQSRKIRTKDGKNRNAIVDNDA